MHIRFKSFIEGSDLKIADLEKAARWKLDLLNLNTKKEPSRVVKDLSSG